MMTEMTTPATSEKSEKRKIDVNFGVVVTDIDVLPPSERGRRSPLHDLISEVKELVASGQVAPGKPVLIANYGNTQSAQSTATSLRHMYGKTPAANGLTVAVRKVNIENEQRAGLFVMYDPSKVTEEGQAQHQKDLVEWNKKQAERRVKAEAKKAEKAKAEAGQKAPAKK